MIKPTFKGYKKFKEEAKKNTVQKHIPIKAIHAGLLITPDNKLVKILKVSTRNMELMSNFEMNQVFDKYEDFLMGLEYPIQQVIVSQPVDLTKYIAVQKETLENTQDEIKKQLLKQYIKYADTFTRSRRMIQRQRYLIYSQQIRGSSESDYIEALEELQERTVSIRSDLEHDLELNIEDASNNDIIKYFHTFFDYQSAQIFPVKDDIQQLITGGNE